MDTDARTKPEKEDRAQISPKCTTKENKHVEIKCTVSVCGDRNTSDHDNVIFVKECKECKS